MKTEQDTSDTLILSETPWITTLIATALVFASVWAAMTGFGADGGSRWTLPVIGLFFAAVLFAMLERTQLILDRTTGRVTLRRRTLLSTTLRDLPLADLRSARVEETRKDRKRLTRPMLFLDAPPPDNRVPVLTAYANGSGADTVAHRINAWLGVPDEESYLA